VIFLCCLLLLIQRTIFLWKNETPTPDWSGIIYLLPSSPDVSGSGSREVYSGKREMGAKIFFNPFDEYGFWNTNNLKFEATENTAFLVMKFR
jgi:hypothetical protein